MPNINDIHDSLISNNESMIDGTETFADLSAFETKLKFKVTCKHSFNKKELYFTNKLKTKDLSNQINTKVQNILDIDGKEYESDKSPIDDIDASDFLELNYDRKRIPAILNLYGKEFEERAILKCYPHSVLGHNFGGRGVKGDMVRVFLKKNDKDEWEVILIDPNHLVAETTYIEDYDRYKNYQYDIRQLL